MVAFVYSGAKFAYFVLYPDQFLQVEGPFWGTKFLRHLWWLYPKLLPKSCVLLVIFVCVNFNDHAGNRQGNTAQALTQWWHPVASSKALDVCHQAMCTASHLCICISMVIQTTNNWRFFIIIDSVIAHNYLSLYWGNQYSLYLVKIRKSWAAIEEKNP